MENGRLTVGKTIRTVSKISELDLDVISTGTPFYVDKNLGSESDFRCQKLFLQGALRHFHNER